MKLFSVLLIMLFVGCQQNIEGITNITVVELQTEIGKNKNIQILDVRTPSEWQAGAIKGAIKVNVFDKNFNTEVDKVLNKDKAVYVYCRSGRRSLKASKILAEKGYEVYNVLGGYKAWKSN